MSGAGALLVGALAAYCVAAGRRWRAGGKWSGWRVASFATGIALLAVATAPWTRAWAGHDLRGHMVQHLLLGMLAPLALVLGAPATLLLRSLPVAGARRLTRLLRARPARLLAHPFTALLLDTGGLYLLYLTPLYSALHASAVLEGAMHLHFLAAGYLFAWSVAGQDPAPHRPGLRVRLAALFVAIAAHGTLAKLMYAHGWPRGTHHDPAQIRDAAQLMYYGGDLAELLLAIALFATWYRRAGRRGAIEEGPARALARDPPVHPSGGKRQRSRPAGAGRDPSAAS